MTAVGPELPCSMTDCCWVSNVPVAVVVLAAVVGGSPVLVAVFGAPDMELPRWRIEWATFWREKLRMAAGFGEVC